MSIRSRKRGIMPSFVDARADAADQPGLLEFRQRPEAAVVQLGQIGRHPRIGGVMRDVQVMDQQQIDAWQAEALQAVLEAAHHAVVAVVEAVLELEPAAPEAVLEMSPRRGRREIADRPWWTST